MTDSMKVSERDFLAFAAGVLGVRAEALSLASSMETLEQWDSIAQLNMVAAVATEYGLEIPFAEVTQVTSLWEIFRRLNGLSPKKVIATDLDGTLWKGVVGEDGPEAIVPNEAYVARLRAMKDRGVLLVALSKNNQEDALAGIARCANGETGLSIDDFVAVRLNWESKAENLLAVARELNLGVDAFVFVDDNPVERMEMQARLPAVTVFEVPPVALESYFPTGVITEEDRHKTEEYKAEALRRDFLGDLEVWTDTHLLELSEIPRVSQLSQKANQFNVCTHRYTEDDIRAFDSTVRVFTVHAGDRFGDQGLVAYVIVCGSEVRDFVMSCRVAGRGIEERAWGAVERALLAAGLTKLTAVWQKTAKNVPVKDLFDRLGFKLVSETEERKEYERVLG